MYFLFFYPNIWKSLQILFILLMAKSMPLTQPLRCFRFHLLNLFKKLRSNSLATYSNIDQHRIHQDKARTLSKAGILTTRPSAIFSAALGLMGSDKFFCNLSKNVKQILEKVVIDINFLKAMPILQNSNVQYFLPNGKQILENSTIQK